MQQIELTTSERLSLRKRRVQKGTSRLGRGEDEAGATTLPLTPNLG